MVRILLISSNSSGRGGGERYLVFLAQGLISVGIDVHVLISDSEYMNSWAEEYSRIGVVLHRATLTGLSQRRLRFVGALLDFGQINTISTLCRRISPCGILVNQQYDEDGLDYILGALRSGVSNVVSTLHMPMSDGKHSRPLGRLRGAVLRWWYRLNALKLIFVSKGAQAEFERYYRHPRPTYVVNNGVPLGSLDTFPVLDRRRVFEQAPVIGFVGQFVEQKNLRCLVGAWAALGARGMRTKLLLVGDGPKRSELQEILSELNCPDSWTITGWTSRPELILRGIDIFVMSSHYEGLPLGLVEAAARGITSVVTPFNGARDIADFAPWVYITDGYSQSALADKLENIIINRHYCLPVSNDQLESFRAHFSVDRMVREVLMVMGSPR